MLAQEVMKIANMPIHLHMLKCKMGKLSAALTSLRLNIFNRA